MATIIIHLCFSCGGAIILSSAFLIHDVWPYGIVLAKYIYVNHRLQFSFV